MKYCLFEERFLSFSFSCSWRSSASLSSFLPSCLLMFSKVRLTCRCHFLPASLSNLHTRWLRIFIFLFLLVSLFLSYPYQPEISGFLIKTDGACVLNRPLGLQVAAARRFHGKVALFASLAVGARSSSLPEVGGGGWFVLIGVGCCRCWSLWSIAVWDGCKDAFSKVS